jgi:hypothetical protein
MRNLLLTGAAGLLLTLGAAAAYAVPQNSPYATMLPPDAVDGYSTDNDQGYGNSGMSEGRSTYVDPQYGYDDAGYADTGYGYYSSPAPVGRLYFGGRGGHFGGAHFGYAARHGR